MNTLKANRRRNVVTHFVITSVEKIPEVGVETEADMDRKEEKKKVEKKQEGTEEGNCTRSNKETYGEIAKEMERKKQDKA